MRKISIVINDDKFYIVECDELPISIFDLWMIFNIKLPSITCDISWLGPELKKLSEKVINEFNGDKGRTQLSFNNKEDAESCLQWIESVLILNKLVGNEE